RLDAELRRIRHSLASDLGVPFPGVVMRPLAALAHGAYTICINEIPVWRDSLTGRKQLAAATGNIDEGGPSQLKQNSPIPISQRSPTRAGEPPGPERILAQNILRVMRAHADEFIGIQEVQLLLRRLAEEYPDLERELQRNVPLPRLTEVLKRLVHEDISIRNLREIAHGLIEWAPREKDTALVTEYVRTCLSRYISHRFANADGSLSAIVLHPTVEEQMRQALRQTPAGTILMLNPATSQQIAAQIRRVLQPFVNANDGPTSVVLLTLLELRPHLRKLTEIELGRVPVLSYQELVPTIRVNTLASVAL
ncbi:MAG: FHIPEP family type III secretion protein, partial [Steroidobacter sp.]